MERLPYEMTWAEGNPYCRCDCNCAYRNRRSICPHCGKPKAAAPSAKPEHIKEHALLEDQAAPNWPAAPPAGGADDEKSQ